jgi:hypothetical protein
MEFVILYIISIIVSGYYIYTKYDEFKFRLSIRRQLSHGDNPNAIMMFISLYLVTFVPIMNTLIASLIITDFIYDTMHKRK